MASIRYPLGNETSERPPAKLLYVTYSKYEQDWESLPHCHHFTELCYVLSGSGSYDIEGRQYPVQESDFIIVNANTNHTEHSAGDSPLEYIILGVEGIDFFSEQTPGSIIFNCKEAHGDFVFYMKALLREMEEQKEGYELMCRNLLELLIVNLTRRTALSHQFSPVIRASYACMKLKQYIDSNFTREITLDTLSSIAHLNKYYLVHAFTKMFGCSPINYLSRVRLKTAKELLTSTNLSITEIAQTSGFSSQSYFAQCFQKHCGMTAGAYRKAHQAGGSSL